MVFIIIHPVQGSFVQPTILEHSSKHTIVEYTQSLHKVYIVIYKQKWVLKKASIHWQHVVLSASSKSDNSTHFELELHRSGETSDITDKSNGRV